MPTWNLTAPSHHWLLTCGKSENVGFHMAGLRHWKWHADWKWMHFSICACCSSRRMSRMSTPLHFRFVHGKTSRHLQHAWNSGNKILRHFLICEFQAKVTEQSFLHKTNMYVRKLLQTIQTEKPRTKNKHNWSNYSKTKVTTSKYSRGQFVCCTHVSLYGEF